MEDGEGGEVDVGVSVLEEGLEVGNQVVEGGLVELVEALDEHDGLLLDGGPRDRNGGGEAYSLWWMSWPTSWDRAGIISTVSSWLQAMMAVQTSRWFLLWRSYR